MLNEFEIKMIAAALEIEEVWNPAGGDYDIPEEMGGSELFDAIENLVYKIEEWKASNKCQKSFSENILVKY